MDGLSQGQCLGGLVGSIFYVFGHKRRHRQWNIFGQVLKEAEIADHLRIICGYLKCVVHKHLMAEILFPLQWNLVLLGICSGKRTESWLGSLSSSAWN